MSTPEKLMGHYNSLKEKHDALDKEIEDAYAHHVDDVKLHEMKAKKLHLKEQMFDMEQRLKDNGKSILHGNR
jgi:hypothetical protein